MLEARGVTVRFGGILAVDCVDLVAEAGQVTGVIGPNGSGKTTLYNIWCGLQRPDEGSVWLGGRDVTRMSTSSRARLGLARTFQRLELFDVLTCHENVLVALEARGRRPRGPIHDEVSAIIARAGLSDVESTRADELPTGKARLLEVARALATAPKVLLLDEPAAGLDQRETESLSLLVRSLADEGLAVVLVEHDIAMVMQVCDRIVVLETGRVVADGDPQAVRNDPAVIEAYFGSPVG